MTDKWRNFPSIAGKLKRRLRRHYKWLPGSKGSVARGEALSKMLSSWKEIAHFFGKGVRTVQRWEKTLDLPIHRPPGAPSNVVLARTSDLEEWMHRGPIARSEAESSSGTQVIASLPALEREISRLAEAHGVSTDGLEDASSTDDRVSALTGIVARVNTKLGSSAVRAA